jgi:hypothetical protein
MVLMAGAFGADQRLVAFMQYLRVLIVSVAAAFIARPLGGYVAAFRSRCRSSWFPPIEPVAFAATIADRRRGAWRRTGCCACRRRNFFGAMVIGFGVLHLGFGHRDAAAALAAGGQLRRDRLGDRPELQPARSSPMPRAPCRSSSPRSPR